MRNSLGSHQGNCESQGKGPSAPLNESPAVQNPIEKQIIVVVFQQEQNRHSNLTFWILRVLLMIGRCSKGDSVCNSILNNVCY